MRYRISFGKIVRKTREEKERRARERKTKTMLDEYVKRYKDISVIDKKPLDSRF